MIRTPIQGMVFQSVDRGFDGRMLSPRLDKIRRMLDGFGLGGQSALPGQSNVVYDVGELCLIAGAVKSLVKTTAVQFREFFLRGGNHFNRNLVIRLFYHDVVMQDKTVLILKDAHLQSQFLGDPGLSLADPLGMRFENRKHLLMMRDGFIIDRTASYLIDLPLGMGYILLDCGQLKDALITHRP